MKPTDWKKVPTVRLIDADKITLPDDLPYKASVRRVLAMAPPVDAVEVVRCKDCKHWDGLRSCNYIKSHGLLCFGFGENGFCSIGERKESNGDGQETD